MTAQPQPAASTTASNDRELVLKRIIAAPPARVYRCWTDAALLPTWFCPPPWKVSHAELDVRPGGSNFIVMAGPNGEEMPNRGVYLEVVPNRRLVATDAYVRAWEPSEKPFLTIDLDFADAGDGRTAYTARALHWSVADREAHEAMGFHQGWGIATDQLEALAKSLSD